MIVENNLDHHQPIVHDPFPSLCIMLGADNLRESRWTVKMVSPGTYLLVCVWHFQFNFKASRP